MELLLIIIRLIIHLNSNQIQVLHIKIFFFMILPNLPMILIAIHDIQLHVTQLAMELSYMTILHNCHNNNNITIYLTQIATTDNTSKRKTPFNTTKKNNDGTIYNHINNFCQINKSTYKYLQLN